MLTLGRADRGALQHGCVAARQRDRKGGNGGGGGIRGMVIQGIAEALCALQQYKVVGGMERKAEWGVEGVTEGLHEPRCALQHARGFWG